MNSTNDSTTTTKMEEVIAAFRKGQQETDAKFVAKFMAAGLTEEEAKKKVEENRKRCEALVDALIKANHEDYCDGCGGELGASWVENTSTGEKVCHSCDEEDEE